MENMETVLSAQVVRNVGEGGAGSLGYTVIDDDQILNLRRRWQVPQAVPRLSLLYFSHLMSGHSALCRREIRSLYMFSVMTVKCTACRFKKQPDKQNLTIKQQIG